LGNEGMGIARSMGPKVLANPSEKGKAIKKVKLTALTRGRLKVEKVMTYD